VVRRSAPDLGRAIIEKYLATVRAAVVDTVVTAASAVDEPAAE
jgi:hypothetical protein